MSDSNGNTAAEPQTVSVEEYNKAVARAQRFEGQVADYEKRYKPLGDPDDIRGKLDHYKELSSKDAGGDPEKIAKLVAAEKAELEKRFGTALETATKERDTLAQDVKHLRVTNVAMQKLSGKVTTDGLKLIKPVIDADCDIEDGEIVIKGADGKARYSKTNPQKKMDLDEYVAELETNYQSIFVSTAVAGGKQAGTKMDAKPGKHYTLAELKSMPDGGKAAMQAMEAADPGSLQKLLIKNN